MKNLQSLGFILLMFLTTQIKAQESFSFSCPRDTTYDGCAHPCITLKARIPDIRSSSSNYVVNQIAGAGVSTCFNPYVSPNTGGTSAALTTDDIYSRSIALPFPFTFYGTTYNNCVISTNGLISFNTSLARAFSHYGILASGGFLSATTGSPRNLPSNLYDEAIIMGAYHDIVSANGRIIKYDVVGNAPHRKWVLSYYQIPLFSCTSSTNNTQQIVLYEGTGIVEVFMYSKQICNAWNQGRAMIGMQNFAQNQGIMAPGRAASDAPWGSVNMNESWRFVPSAGDPLYRSTQLFDLNGNLVATGDTVGVGNGILEASFPNVCSGGNTTYVVKTTYEQNGAPGSFIYSTDTINVITSSITANYTIQNNNCHGNSNGVINAAGTGGGNYDYSIDGVNFQTSGVFNNLAAGTYTVSVRDNSIPCTRDTVITITEPDAITSTISTVNATCSVTPNGTLDVTGAGGVPGYEYSLDGTTYQSSGTFTVADGDYIVSVRDANGCVVTFNDTVHLTNDLVVTPRSDTSICLGVSVPLSATGNADSYSWSGPGVSGNVATPSSTGLSTYTVTATLGQCTQTATFSVLAESLVHVNAGLNTTILSGETVQLNATVTGASSFLWTSNPLDETLSSTTVLNPTATPTATTTYTLSATNAAGCTDEDDIIVTVVPYCVKVNNAFSPNGDGINDMWHVYDSYDCLKNVTVAMFNRYGSKVFESNDYHNDWNGTYKGKPVPDGTYYAVINFTLVSGKKITKKSDVTVIR